MMCNKNFFLIFFLAAITIPSLHAPNVEESVIIAEKKQSASVSKNERKEDIGGGLKELLECTSSLLERYGKLFETVATLSASTNDFFEWLKSMGLVLARIAALQKLAVFNLERLIDNRKPFKHATHQQLEKTYAVITETLTLLKKHHVDAVLKNKESVAQLAHRAQRWQEELAARSTLCKKDECLK